MSALAERGKLMTYSMLERNPVWYAYFSGMLNLVTGILGLLTYSGMHENAGSLLQQYGFGSKQAVFSSSPDQHRL